MRHSRNQARGKQKRVGVALSGGTAKSVTHVGALRALIESDVDIDMVSGTSGGAIAAVAYAAGLPMNEIEQVANELTWSKLASFRLTKLGIVSSRRIESFIDDVVGKKTFEELPIPCSVTATDLLSGDRKVFTSGPVGLAVRASCSLPNIFLPVEIDNRYYVDGGLAEYLPIRALQEMGADYTIGIHLAGNQENDEKPGNILQLLLQVTSLVARQNLQVSAEVADYVLAPDVDHFGSFDFSQSEELIQAGYDTVVRHLPALRDNMIRRQRFWTRIGTRFRKNPRILVNS